MSVVVDANLIAALVIPLPYSDAAASKIKEWKQNGVEISAPFLLEYEVITILRKASAAGLLTGKDLIQSLDKIMTLRIQKFPPTMELHRKALWWAERLGQSKAYDGQYLSVAEHSGAEFWTADERLAKAAKDAGALWVHWIGEGR